MSAPYQVLCFKISVKNNNTFSHCSTGTFRQVAVLKFICVMQLCSIICYIPNFTGLIAIYVIGMWGFGGKITQITHKGSFVCCLGCSINEANNFLNHGNATAPPSTNHKCGHTSLIVMNGHFALPISINGICTRWIPFQISKLHPVDLFQMWICKLGSESYVRDLSFHMLTFIDIAKKNFIGLVAR